MNTRLFRMCAARRRRKFFPWIEVLSVNPQSNEVMHFDPFYSFRHATLRDKKQTFWLAHRRPSAKSGDEGTDVTLSLVDLSARPVRPDADTLTVRTTCTNRDLPSRLQFGNDAGDFELEGGAAIKRIVALKKPTNAIASAFREGRPVAADLASLAELSVAGG